MSPKKRPYSRSQLRARFRKPKARRSGSLVWGVAITLVVVLGIGAIALARSDRGASADVAPFPGIGETPGSHWHAYLGVNVCGEWLPEAPSFDSVAGSGQALAGIHSHGDGNIHIHPHGRHESGHNATVGRFMDYGGWSVSEDSLELWDAQTHRDGDECTSGEFAGQTAELRWTVDGELQEGNLADHRPQDGEIIAVYSLPEGAALEEPPGAVNAIANPIDEPGGAAPPVPPGDPNINLEDPGAPLPAPEEAPATDPAVPAS